MQARARRGPPCTASGHSVVAGESTAARRWRAVFSSVVPPLEFQSHRICKENLGCAWLVCQAGSCRRSTGPLLEGDMLRAPEGLGGSRAAIREACASIRAAEEMRFRSATRRRVGTRLWRGRTARLPRCSGHDRAGSLKSGVSRLPGTTPAMRPPDRLGGRAARGPLPSGTPSTRIRGAGRRTRGPRIRPGGVAPPPGGP